MRVFTHAKIYAKMNCILETRKKIKTNEEVKLKMAERKTWLMKFKSRISKLKLNKPKLKTKCEEKVRQNKLPDLITPTYENINAIQKKIQREEAIRVKQNKVEFNTENGHLMDVPRVRSNSNR